MPPGWGGGQEMEGGADDPGGVIVGAALGRGLEQGRLHVQKT